jgi:hypothetical protein
MAPAKDPVRPDDISASIFQNLGIDPKLEIPSGNGRPITLFREGAVIDSIIA